MPSALQIAARSLPWETKTSELDRAITTRPADRATSETPIGLPGSNPKPDLAREDQPIGTAIDVLWTIVVESAIPNSLRRLAAIPNSRVGECLTALPAHPRMALRVGPQRSWSGVNVSTAELSGGFEFGIAGRLGPYL
jgi:hypothetical protein